MEALAVGFVVAWALLSVVYTVAAAILGNKK